jgi:exosortase
MPSMLNHECPWQLKRLRRMMRAYYPHRATKLAGYCHRLRSTLAIEFVFLPLALVLMFIPVLLDLFRALQWDEHAANALFILLVCSALVWRQAHQQADAQTHLQSVLPHRITRIELIFGGLSLALGLALYVIGRMLEISLFALAALPLVLTSALLLAAGRAGLRRYRNVLCLTLLALPLPGIIADALTAPLKMAVSVFAERLLVWCAYPVARSGVILHLGPYQLLVADACSGLQSILSLLTISIVYLQLRQSDQRARSTLHIATLMCALIPFAFIANVVRVVALAAVTYHLGAERGTQFLHGYAGPLMLICVVSLLLASDALLYQCCGAPAQAKPQARA